MCDTLTFEYKINQGDCVFNNSQLELSLTRSFLQSLKIST